MLDTERYYADQLICQFEVKLEASPEYEKYKCDDIIVFSDNQASAPLNITNIVAIVTFANSEYLGGLVSIPNEVVQHENFNIDSIINVTTEELKQLFKIN